MRWPAYHELVTHASSSPALELDPRDFSGLVAAMGHERAAALLFAHRLAGSMDDGVRLVESLVADASQGRRPRCGLEVYGEMGE